MGNLYSVHQACIEVGIDSQISQDPKEILNTDLLIIPGVGCFPQAMKNLKDLELLDVIAEFVRSGKHLLGVCLGAQLLFSHSEEFEKTAGLNLIKGSVNSFRKFSADKDLIVPHVGWNQVLLSAYASDHWFSNVNQLYYFVHSFVMNPEDAQHIISYTDYCDVRFASVVSKDNCTGIQFHPEKSGREGLKIFESLRVRMLKAI